MRFFLGCTFAVSLHAASFVQVQCEAQLGAPVRYSETATSTSCSSLNPDPSRINGGSSVSGAVTLQMATDPSQFSTLFTSQSGSAREAQAPGGITGIGTIAELTIDYQTAVVTAGPVRSGYIEVGPNTYGIPSRYFSGSSGMTSGIGIDTTANFATTTYCS
jgi:hypothetical protein